MIRNIAITNIEVRIENGNVTKVTGSKAIIYMDCPPRTPPVAPQRSFLRRFAPPIFTPTPPQQTKNEPQPETVTSVENDNDDEWKQFVEMDNSDIKANIFYLSREKLYNTMLKTCKFALTSNNSDISFHFYHALALLLNKRYQESTRELNLLKSEESVHLASVITLMYSHKFMGTHDKELFTKLDAEMREFRKSANSVDYYNTSYALFAIGKYEKALDYIEKAINMEKRSADYFSLRGWIYIYFYRHKLRKDVNISEAFQNALSDNIRNLDASIGMSEAFLIEGKSDEAINIINKAVVRFPAMVLPLVQKMKLLFNIQDFEQTLEVINRIIDIEAGDLDATKTNILILLCRDANYVESAVQIKRYVQKLESKESTNPQLFLDNAQLFSRICGQNMSVLSETYAMVEKAVEVSPNSPDLITELGYQCLLQNATKDAARYFKTASKIDDTSVNALMGMTLCELIENGKSEQVRHQIDFLLELQDKNIPPLLLLMNAKISEEEKEVLKTLDKAYDIHMKQTVVYPYGSTYLKQLNPIFLLDVAKEYLRFISYTSNIFNHHTLQRNSGVINTVLEILKTITKACPGLQDALNLLAKILYLKGDTAEAMSVLEHIIKNIENSSSDAYLLMAQIQVSTGMFERAAQSLESGLSHNFKVRENALYHLISGLIEKNRHNSEEAVKYFTTALGLVDLKQRDLSKKKQQNLESFMELTSGDKASIYAELINAHMKLNQIHEATRLLQDATEEFRGTPEEAKIMLVSAEHVAKNKDSQSAIDMLSKVKPDDPYYLTAKTKLADIFLKSRKDKRAYLQCYQEMVDNNPGPDSFLLLGDAYLHILDPDRALECYERALKTNPTDPVLTSKMGKALVSTHYYKRAVSYYKNTIRQTGDPELKLQLVDLYMQLKQMDNAEQLLKSEIEIEKNKNVNDLTAIKYRTNLLHFLAQIQEKGGNIQNAITTLKTATDNQIRVRKLYSLDQSAIPQDETDFTIFLYMKLAELSTMIRENEQAAEYYKDALIVSPDNLKILASLSKHYMQMNYMDQCQQTCSKLLSLDPDNEDGIVLMADIAFRKIDFDMAIYHFTQLLSKQPTNWRAFIRFIEIMRRTGNLDDVQKYLQQAEKSLTSPSKEPGLCYCVALYQWYSGNLNGALRNFNIARQHSDWSRQAIYNMIEICLNPEDEILGEHFIDIDDIEYKDSRSMALKTAERLLKELKQKTEGSGEDDLKYKLFKNFLLLANKDKSNVELALEDFIFLASQDLYKDQIGPILGIASAYTMLRQGQRAKNQLKRVAKSIWSFEDAEYLERCWLLLADYYIQSSKFDMAADLLKRVLQHNKACSKAHEYFAFIAEKEQRYRDAANAYEMAWKFGGKSNPAIGYKLAYNLMKCKKYADAIDVSQQVLKSHPDYPKLRKDVLDKSMNNLRT